MMKKISYLLISTCLTISIAEAESSNAMQLSFNEMDQVTAGSGATATANAFGYSPVLAFAKTATIATTALTGNGKPALTGGAASAGGLAGAAATGNGSASMTSASSSANPGVASNYSLQLNIHSSGQIVSASGSAIFSIIAPSANPF